MNIAQVIKMAWKSIRSNKMRAFLTMLGVIIGVFSVITLVSLGQGATGQVTTEMEKLGTNMISISLSGRGSKESLTLKEAYALSNINYVQNVAPVSSGQVKAKHGNKNVTVSLEGITSEYEEIRDFHVQQGRFILPVDVDYRQKIAVIGTQTSKDLFGSSDPVGEDIVINGYKFKVVGLLEEKGSSFMGSNDSKILIPITAAQHVFSKQGINAIYVRATDSAYMKEVATEIERDLSLTFRDKDKKSFTVFNQQDALDSFNTITQTLTMTLGGIAGISLLVGGIGIMNIMLVSVTERTREIGIRKAIGAKKRDILIQFLIESIAISAIGGIIGILLGVSVATLLGKLLNVPISFSIGVIIFSFSFSLFVGVFFGLYPANKAAKLRPIDALRVD